MSALPTATPLLYEDDLGVEQTMLELLDEGIQFSLRGTLHRGISIDAADPPGQPWRNCRFEGSLPLWITVHDRVLASSLKFAFTFGPEPSRGPELKLTLQTPHRDFEVEQRSGDFWDGLRVITALLPPGLRLRCCYGCQYSDYSPCGQATFGSMVCVYENRERWMEARGNGECFEAQGDDLVWLRETHICEHYSPRLRPAGYRGI